MRSRFVRPETRRLELSDGDWLLVRGRLTHGETVDAQAWVTRTTEEGRVQIDPGRISDATVLAYLLDWSLPEFAIKGEPITVVASALRALDQDDFDEIKAAIDAHDTAQRAARETEKKTRTGATASAPTLPSLVGVGGPMTRSET